MQGATLLALSSSTSDVRSCATGDVPQLPPRSVTAGSSEVTVYTYGEDLYRDMLNAISQAKSRIFFESFIWKGDAVGQAFKDALIDAANRGVKVYAVFDEFANLVVPRSFFVFPKNIAVRRHPLVASGFRFPRNTGRDHRKLLVVDDVVAFIGGYNIGSLYATDWRDTHARLTGDIVWDVQNAFIDFWNLWAGRRRAAIARLRQPDLAAGHSDPPQHAAQHGLSDSRHVSRCHRPRVPSHLPDPRLLHPRHRTSVCADSSCPTRGRRADHHPAESNHIVADWLSRGFYSHLLRNGVRLLLYQGAMVACQDRDHRQPMVDDRYREHRPAEPARQLRDQHGGLQHRRRPADGGNLRRSTPATPLSSPWTIGSAGRRW